MSSQFVRFRDLKARGIADSWAQLDNLIKKYGFPPGRLLGPATRVWDLEEEIEPWLASRPVEGPALRGAAKARQGWPPRKSEAAGASAPEFSARFAPKPSPKLKRPRPPERPGGAFVSGLTAK